jgi:cardiolipin synthase
MLRDLIIVTGATLWNFRIGQLQAEPTIVSKINTFVQIVLVLSVLVQQALGILPAGVVPALVWITLATTVSSGIDYVWIWSKRAREAVNGTKP